MREALLATALLPALSSHAHAQEYSAQLDAFVAFAQENGATEDGSWLEMRNVLGEWEKVILVFGYIGDGAACADILAFAADQNPSRRYRCNPVN